VVFVTVTKMQLLIIIGFFAVLLVVFGASEKEKRKSNKLGEKGEEWPFVARKTLLTETEQILFWRITEACPRYVIQAQVGLSRLIDVQYRTTNRKFWFYKIAQKSVDFVICRKDTSVVVAIELDDASHDSDERRKADADKTKALETAGIKLIRWHVKEMPDVLTIRRQLAEIMVEQRKAQNGTKLRNKPENKVDHGVEPTMGVSTFRAEKY
jgi:very-short-patch-repair endonuclease